MQSLPESGVRGTLMHDGLAGSKALSASKARAMRTTCANYPRADEREGLGWLGQAGEQLLERGERHHPYSQPRGHAQGNAGPVQAKHKAHKLLRRLHPYRGDVWRFMTDAGAFYQPPGRAGAAHGQGAPEGLGVLRTREGADVFFTIRLYLATMHKQRACLFECLISAFKGQPVQPCLLG